MEISSKSHWLSPFLIGFLGACCVFALYNSLFPISLDSAAKAQISDTPGMDYIDAHQCAPAEDKIVMLRGKEDNFSREGSEPANINPALLESPYYRDLSADRNKVHGFRDYDERGVDKILYDYFDIPDGIIEGFLILGVEAQGNIESDAISLGDSVDDIYRAGDRSRYNYSISLANSLKDLSLVDHNNVIVLPLSAFTREASDKKVTALTDYLKQLDRRKTLDLRIQDDAMIDFSALVICSRPALNKGTTFTEMSSKLFGPNISFLGCNINRSQSMCDPYAGDLLCSETAPLGCFRDGSARPPDSSSNDFPTRHFVGGTVRLTEPVRGDQFKTYTDASEYCRMLYGPDWRVLSFHEAGGAAVVTWSDVAVNSRVWVDVSDQSYSNCWSRE